MAVGVAVAVAVNVAVAVTVAEPLECPQPLPRQASGFLLPPLRCNLLLNVRSWPVILCQLPRWGNNSLPKQFSGAL